MSDEQTVVCILDDDPDIRKSLERVLSVHGYCPRSFASINEFYKGAKPQEAACLILDIHLDGESGIDLKRQLSNSVPALPVIFITGRDSEANRHAVQQVGGAAYLTKPFGSKVLLEAIESATRKRS
jgi:FixJ family two-component response regulator